MKHTNTFTHTARPPITHDVTTYTDSATPIHANLRLIGWNKRHWFTYDQGGHSSKNSTRHDFNATDRMCGVAKNKIVSFSLDNWRELVAYHSIKKAYSFGTTFWGYPANTLLKTGLIVCVFQPNQIPAEIYARFNQWYIFVFRIGFWSIVIANLLRCVHNRLDFRDKIDPVNRSNYGKQPVARLFD